MKKKILCLSLSLLLCACSGVGDSRASSLVSESDAETSSNEGTSSSFDGDFDLWTEDEKALMMTYCGTLLPHPYDLVGGAVEVEEQTSNGESCLVLYNFAEEWTLKDYYLMLQGFGWNAIPDYEGNLIHTQSGSEYVELTREDEDGSGYELMYYHVDNSSSDGDSYNCIVCYNSYVSDKTDKTAWDEKETEDIEYVTSSSLPFFALGSNYSYGQASETEIDFYDYCSRDFSNEIIAALKADGYQSDEKKSEEYGCYYVGKTLADGSKIEILVNYYRGNNVYVYFTPKMNESSSWPSEFLKDAEEILGSSIPSFGVAKNGVYKTYILHGVSYVITYDLDSSYDYYSYLENINSELFSWEEKLDIASYLLVDSAGNETGFMLQFKPSEPTSTFVSAWPSEAIAKGIKDSLNVEGVEIPSLDLSSYNLPKDMKYKIVTAEDYQKAYEYYLNLYKENYGDVYSLSSLESMAKSYTDKLMTQGMTLSIYDSTLDEPVDFVVRYKINEAYKDLLYKSGWYLAPDTGSTTYEDPTGQIQIAVNNTPYDDYGYTSIVISEGSGEAHTPTIKFRQDSYEAGTGISFNPILDVSMLPYEVTYSCSDTTGKVTIDSSTGKVSVAVDAEIGSTCEIYASCTDSEGIVHTAKADIKVVKGVNYATNMEEVEELLKAKGYTEYTIENIYAIGSTTDVRGERLIMNFGQTMTKKEVKDLVENSLVPESFVSTMWSKEDDDSYSSPALPGAHVEFGKKSASKKTSDKEYLYCFRIEDYASFSLDYYVYTDSNKDIILSVESRRYR